MGFYIYKHLDKHNNCIYVGLTTDMHSRQLAHSHKSIHRHKINTIVYADAINKTAMLLYEKYYINKLNPKYNIEHARDDDISFLNGITELKFKEYKLNKNNVKIVKKIKKNRTQFSLDFERYYHDIINIIDNIFNQVETLNSFYGYKNLFLKNGETDLCIYIKNYNLHFEDTFIKFETSEVSFQKQIIEGFRNYGKTKLCVIKYNIFKSMDFDLKDHNHLKLPEQKESISIHDYFYKKVKLYFGDKLNNIE